MAPKQKVVSKKHIARLERERRQAKLIQYISIAVVAAVVLILLYGYLDLNYLRARQPIVEVNGEKVTTKEFQARVVMQRTELINTYMQYTQFQQFGMDVSQQLQQIEMSLSVPSVVGQQVFDAMVNETLIRQEAAKLGISLSEDEVESYIREQFGYFPDGTPTPAPTTEPVEVVYPTLSAEQLAMVTVTPVPTEGPTSTPAPTATVDPAVTPEPTSTPAPTPLPTATATPYTLEGYQGLFGEVVANVAQSGLTEAQYRRLFETDLLRTKLIDAVVTDVPKEEEQVWARHILVQDATIANLVIERLKAGEDFGELAAELSQDPGSAAQGGDLGWFGKGQMVAPFEEAAFSLEIGEVSAPVQSDFGWHVIQVLGRTTVPMSESAYEQARQEAFNEFLTQVREEAGIKTYDYWTERIPASPNLQDYQIPQ